MTSLRVKFDLKSVIFKIRYGLHFVGPSTNQIQKE